MSDTTRDSIDIEDVLDGSIESVIEELTALAKEYPGAKIDVGTRTEYGETYVSARLQFTRDKEPIEIELDEWSRKARLLSTLQHEAGAFAANETPYPRADEIATLRAELGFFAMAPKQATLSIYDNEILVMDMMRGGRRRDGTFVFKMMMPSSAEFDKMYEAVDAQYRV